MPRSSSKYETLKTVLRQRVAGMGPGERLPSEAELCRTYNISRTTVRKALDDLIREGLVHSMQGKGTFTTSHKFSSNWVQYSRGFAADMADHGVNITRRMLARTTEPAGEDVAQALQIMNGTAVVKFIRLRYAGEQPYDIVTNYLPLHLFPDIEGVEWPENSLYSLLRLHYGVQLGRGVRTVEADLCTTEEARLLGIRPKSPVLVLNSTMYDVHGYPVEYGIARQRADRARLVINVLEE